MKPYPIGPTDVTQENQREVRETVNQMKRLGHAISYDSTEDSEMRFLSARVLHFRTCRACNEQKQEENSSSK
jgi:ABC-type sugar transport system ATPase subunit